MSKAAASRIIAAETGKRSSAVLRYLGDAAVQPDIDGPYGPLTPAEVWERARDIADEAALRHSTLGRATITVDENIPFGMLLSADEHLDSSGTALGVIEKMAKLVSVTEGLYAGLVGDLRDNFIIKQIMMAAIKARFPPAQQMALVEHYVSLFGPGKVLFMVGGNHDAWERKLSGIDSLERLAAQNRVIYDTDQFFIRLKVGGQEYKLLMRHKGRGNSMYNPTHVCMQAMRMGVADEPPDVVVMGHTHEPGITEWVWYGMRRLAVKVGSAKLHDDWAREMGFPPGAHMAPVLIFWPDRRKVLAFWDHEEGADYLKYLRRSR